MRIQARLKGAVAPVALAVMLVGKPVLAQETPADEAQAEAASAADEAETGGAIVVTGSRIRSVTPFNSPDPVTVIDPEIASREGKFDLASTLQSSPIAAGSTQITSAISSNFVTAGGPGAQTIDLRGLGPNRTLVLLNGRRAGPAGTRGAVSSFDLNVLPQSIAQNVQILKTGASSVYGSDAIAGVVNIITKTEMDGFEIDANVSVPFDSGGEEYRISGIWGKVFDRGHIMIAGDYSKTEELKRGDRAYLACPEAYTFRPDGSRADLIDPRTGQYKCEDLRWGHVWTYNLIDNLQLDGPDGPDTGVNTSPNGQTVLLQYQYPGETLGIPAFGAPAYSGDFGAPAGWFPTGYDTASLAVQNAYHPFVEEQTLIPETSLYTAYVEGAYDLTDSVEMFGEFLFNRRKTYQNGWRQFWNFGYTGDLYGTGAGNAWNYWGGGFAGINLFSPTAITNHADTSQKVDYYRGVGGLRGDFGGSSDWRWEAYVQYSKSLGRYRTEQILQDVYDSGYFQTSSCVGTVLPFSGKQCVDMPWADPFFLRGELTPQQIDFAFDWEEGLTKYTQLTGEATVDGTLIELPAGPLSIAAGVAIREDRINDTPGYITFAENPYFDASIDVDSLSRVGPDTDGDGEPDEPSEFDLVCRGVALARIDRRYPCDEFHGNAWGNTTSGITAGESLTTEAFAELNIPILADQDFFKELTLSAAGRVTNVKATRASDGVTDKDNGNFTYKLGLNWAVNDTVRFRGSYGTSFRAPALFEQFLADETSFPSQRDIDVCVDWGANLAAGLISQRVADNCESGRPGLIGVPADHAGGGVTATAVAEGGLGELEAETSRAWVVGGILTPTFAFLPDTRISVAVDYFDIKVKGEITQLGAANIIFGCYDSESFATEPLCDLFTRGQTSAPYNINEVFDKFVNIASQRNAGVDVAVNVQHDLGKMGEFSFNADMTWQTKDDFQLLPGSPVTSDNGEAGSPEWVGDFRLTWESPWEGVSFFYGLNVIGGTSDYDDFVAANQRPGVPEGCVNSALRGVYCPDLTAPARFYHNFSVTAPITEIFEATVGVSNIFDTRPPRVSVLNGGEIQMIGPVISASQYPFVGRRAFANISAKF